MYSNKIKKSLQLYGLYCGFIFGSLYYMIEFIWNFSLGRLTFQFQALSVSFLIYTAVFIGLGLLVSLLIGLVPPKKTINRNLAKVQCGWICTAISGSFFIGLFLVIRVFFSRSDFFKNIVIILLAFFTVAACYILYLIINRCFRNSSEFIHKTFHHCSFISVNLFIILTIKINYYLLKTQPWSAPNLFWIMIAFLGSLTLGMIYFLISHVLHTRGVNITQRAVSIIIIFILSMNLGVHYAFSDKSEKDQNDIDNIETEVSQSPSIILITLDALRADHLTCYGYERETSPNIDTFAEDGVLFKNPICQVPLTRPSLFSIHTGRYPFLHGLIDNFSITPKNIPLLANALETKNYKTAAFVSAEILNSSFNTQFGFQEYYDQIMNVLYDGNFTLIVNLRYLGLIEIKSENSAGEMNKKIFEWLEQNSQVPHFLWLHYFDPHTPYKPIKEYRKFFTEANIDIHKYYEYQWEKDNYDPVHKKVHLSPNTIQCAIDLYDAEIRYLDMELGRLFNKLKSLNIYDRSLIILTADHGESFEHGYYFDHGDRLYDGLIRVPLIIKFPKQKWKSKRIDTQVESIDITSTIQEFSSLKSMHGMTGKSLIPLISGSAKQNSNNNHYYAYSQTPYRGSYFFKAKELQSLRTKQWKYIYDKRTGKQELYNLKMDHKELNDLDSSLIENARQFYSELKKFKSSFQLSPERAEKVELDQTTVEKLKSLGYIQ